MASSNLSSFVLPPLPLPSSSTTTSTSEPALSPPPLPTISDPVILQRVYTHSSYYARQKSGVLLFDAAEEGEDNEKYEHVGDALLGCAITILLQDMYPTLNQGTATLLKSHLVSNETLRQISHYYRLPSHLRAPPDALPVLRNGDRTPANLFEAYLAGVYLSYYKYGLPIRSLPTPPRTPSTSRDNVAEGEDQAYGLVQVYIDTAGSSPPDSALLGPERLMVNGNRTPTPRPTSGEARHDLETHFLRPLFTPIASWVLDQLKNEQKRRQRPTPDLSEDGDVDMDVDSKAVGSSARLNQWFIAKEGGMPDYPTSRSGDSEGWTVMCCATDREGNKWCGQATRPTKKSAMTVAAYKICVRFEDVRPEFCASR